MPYLAKSMPSVSSSSSCAAIPFPRRIPEFVKGPFLSLLGLPLAAGGLLLCNPPKAVVPPVFNGLRSGIGLAGVLPSSANFQNGAGELVGMYVEGKCAVLGGASFGF